ncbi:carboxypeptidase Q [Flavobacteriales bacterium]|nr:Aminopeptidase YwaD [Flavobacteriales bacterium]GIK70259.1 MAG: peptidase M28 [Bacteroidota bacterium]CAG0975416.1 carboxypeptidase Q [Flavobacteriales bacterium]
MITFRNKIFYMRLLPSLIISVFLFSCGHKNDEKQELPCSDAFSLINEEVLKHSEAYQNLQQATATIGHRLTGTENGNKAEEFVFSLFKKYGFSEVQYLPFEANSWLRLSVKTSINGEEIKTVSLAHTPVKADTTAQVIDLGSGLQSDFSKFSENIKGKIVLMNINTLFSDSSSMNLHRSEKTELAIKYGAAGVLFINGVPGEVLLTGTASVTGELIDIPAVCMSLESGNKLRERMAKGEKIQARIEMNNYSNKIMARNVVATWPGTEKSNEVIIIGGHLDSWDLATGAIDNGIGSFSIIDIARTFSALRLTTKRTIKFVLFMGEEEGLLGSKALVKKAKELGGISTIKYMLNLDMTGNANGFNLYGRDEMMSYTDSICNIIKMIDSTFASNNSSSAGLHSDHQPFMLEGIPVLAPNSNMNKEVYNCYHSSCDHFELVNENDMTNNVRFVSMFLFALANTNTIPAKHFSENETQNFLIKHQLKEKLLLGKEWKWAVE